VVIERQAMGGTRGTTRGGGVSRDPASDEDRYRILSGALFSR
jgi:hypothetical protein